MPANGIPSAVTAFSHHNVRTDDFKPTASKTPDLVV